MKILTKALFIMLIFIFASTVSLTINNITVKASSVLQVPSANYPTIQSALNAANNGDTINIASGTYSENINYDGYANNMLNGISQLKTGIILQGAKNTIINGPVTILYLAQFKMDSLIIAGSLTLGNCGVYGYVTNSIISSVQVGSTTTIGGPSDTLTGNTFHGLILKGGNTKMEMPAYKTIIEKNQIINGISIKAGSDANTIKNNTISNAEVGILEELSKTYSQTGDNQITNNTIANNNVGISLYCSTGDTGAPSHKADQITQNIIKNNAVGIEFSASNHFVYGNTIYHNDFITNNIQVKANNPVTNTWDNGQSPQTGNYWSDYTGTDSNNDGVGDTPYIINTENLDNFPLMHLWSAPNPTPIPSPTPTLTPTPTPTSSPNPTNSPTPIPPASPAPSNQADPTPDPTTSPASTTSPRASDPPIPEMTPLAAITVFVIVCVSTIIFRKRIDARKLNK